MAARPDETGDGGEAQEVVPVEDRQFAELIAMQRERNELVARALDIDQQEIQLSYEYDSKELEVQDEQNKRAHGLVRIIVVGFGVVLLLLLYMVFYGSETQADKAEKLLLVMLILASGASLRDLIGRVLKRLINR
ncbi:MAG: hypothetical protein F4Z57_10050 [Gemmatimonadetes bacterium]|nr:hypothetical protein [Gemmatimonadota bacterium]MYC71112.1 hypothetical protein [Gemmatimonadota bacterium]MYI61388.1 hypothetical protein [Gemmatimonadota bacterium]